MLALKTGWTLDYIRAMDSEDYEKVVMVLGEYNQVQQHESIRASERMKG